MRVALVVPSVRCDVNEMVHGYMPPLGLLYVAGALRDAGHRVEMIDADAGRVPVAEVLRRLRSLGPEAVLVGHSGSISAHPAAARLITAVKADMPGVRTVYGGVYPSFECLEVLADVSGLDFIVRGEGEKTVVEFLERLELGSRRFEDVEGLAWRDGDRIRVNGWRRPIADLDRLRPAWELVDWPLYESRHREGRSAVVQFARGCPNSCTYCGQWRFWRRWRRRSAETVVAEIEHLRDEHGVSSIWMADENWASEPGPLHELLELLAERAPDVEIYAAQCATSRQARPSSGHPAPGGAAA